MCQVHKRFTDQQIKVLLQGYDQGQLRRTDLQELLGVGNRDVASTSSGLQWTGRSARCCREPAVSHLA